jgi:hypothetical protein
MDNDCDGSIDEDFTTLGDPCSVGMGECASSGTYICSFDGSDVACDATAGIPSVELCDDLDNDCDGVMIWITTVTVWLIMETLAAGYRVTLASQEFARSGQLFVKMVRWYVLRTFLPLPSCVTVWTTTVMA